MTKEDVERLRKMIVDDIIHRPYFIHDDGSMTFMEAPPELYEALRSLDEAVPGDALSRFHRELLG